ncbi:MAG: glycosyltransferase family 2 protein [Desulfobulbaceae bacterium]|nr:glycosyltransferase family 2 protein [Desulfobulbaceae bacterium]
MTLSESATNNRTLVIIPARNEAETVGRVVREIKDIPGYDVVVIDDRSVDATIAEAKGAGAVVLPLVMRLGAWGAMQTGMRYALAHGYEVVVTMDADGQHPVAAISDLVEPLKKKHVDVTIGACVARGSRQRKIAWRFFKALTGLAIEDLTSGFRAYNLAALQLLASPVATLLDYQDLGVLLLLQKHGLKVSEVETRMSLRVAGRSRIFSSWWVILLYLLESGLLSLSRRNGFRAPLNVNINKG